MIGIKRINPLSMESVCGQPDYAPIAFDKGCVVVVRTGAEAHGYSSREIISGAGRDACYLAGVAPASMVFIPCIDGISHNEIEDVKPEWITAGANMVLSAILDKAGAV